MTTRKRIIIWSVSVAAVLALLIGGCTLYLNDYYRADEDAVSAFSHGRDIPTKDLGGGETAFIPEEADVGLIFYPGGKVACEAYEPLMRALADRGILSVLVDMPFNLAVLDSGAADGIREQFPQIDRWYMCGHSLGGAMAASYISDNAEDFEGLVLLGAYSTADISSTDLCVITLYGSEDRVLDRDKYEKYRANLPECTHESVIEGGCHAHFGMYGEQRGDGDPTITNEEQIIFTANVIREIMFRNEKE